MLLQAKCIVLMIDSKDKDKISEASGYLFDMLNNISILENGVPILICCNKQDLPLARRANQIELDLESELEEHRKVAKAVQNDDD